ncbi:MAG: hypothetical protein HRU00_17435 [Myxococcales bacterium]|nr:hypothetical protein [Myxococcales bacterium]
MDLSKFASRKLIATVLATILVAVADLMGAPLDPATLETIQSMLMTLVGAQGGVDMVSAYKVGTSIAGTAKVVKADGG